MRVLWQNKFLYIRFHTLPTANDTANVTERKVILFTLHILTLSVLAIFLEARSADIFTNVRGRPRDLKPFPIVNGGGFDRWTLAKKIYLR